MKYVLLFAVCMPFLAAAQKGKINFTERLPETVFALSKVMMHDVVNPPAASRFYAYCMMGAYDITTQYDSSLVPLDKLVKHYSSTNRLANKKDIDYRVAALYCVLETGRLLLPSGFMLAEDEKTLLQDLAKHHFSPAVIEGSVALANEVAAGIVSWSKKDNYNKLSARLRYTPVSGDAYWYPTPPAYIEAVEPHWHTIRPLVIDSASQFAAPAPIAFSKDSNSAFYKQAMEVYQTVKGLTKLQLHIASFWDCNPFAISTSGHMAIGFKKISPGGHWMAITGIAAKKATLGFSSSVVLHTVVSITLMDAFICCWQEKYFSNRIRPETYVNKYIDIKWQPLLQTPPFPEYTSGHSVISTAAAAVLTYFLGNNFTYTDNSETMFEIAPRSFISFNQAADEAAISRLYGGIHYRDAVENGQLQGRAIASKIIRQLKLCGIQIKPGSSYRVAAK